MADTKSPDRLIQNSEQDRPDLLTERQERAIFRRLDRHDRLLEVGLLWVGEDGEVSSPDGVLPRLLSEEPREIWRKLLAELPREMEEGSGLGDVHVVDWQGEGASLPLHVRVIPLPVESGRLVVVRDRSSIELLHSDLAIAAQLRNLSRLSLGLAHDLKTPLNNLTLNLELLKRSLAVEGPEGERQARWVAVLERELGRLNRALDAFLAQTLVAEREEPSRVDLAELTAEVGRLVTVQALEQGIRVELETPPDPVFVNAHPERLKLAILNPAINALDAMSGKGTIRLELSASSAEARLEIEDDGRGIPAELQDRVFDLHFTTRDSGTGIGLYVARLSAELSGGTLDLVETGPDGTRFELRLPLADEG